MDIQSAYLELDVSEDDSPSIIKTKYRKLVLDLHPDRNNGKNEARLKRITTAYHTLKDAAKHRISTREQRTAQNTRNSQRRTGRKPGHKMQETKTPQEDWSRFTSEFEKDEAFWKEYERNFWDDYEKRLNTQSKFTDAQKTSQYSSSKKPDHKTQRTKTTTQRISRYDIRIDESLCIGCCSCETIAPKIFHIDKNVNVNPKSHVVDTLGNDIDTILDAAQTCPTKAIIVDDTMTRLQMYPF